MIGFFFFFCLTTYSHRFCKIIFFTLKLFGDLIEDLHKFYLLPVYGLKDRRTNSNFNWSQINCATLYKSLKYSLNQKYLLDMKIKMNKIKCFFFHFCFSWGLQKLYLCWFKRFRYCAASQIYCRYLFKGQVYLSVFYQLHLSTENSDNTQDRLLLMDTAFFFKVMRWSLGWQFLKP